jgi:hypothetical protein
MQHFILSGVYTLKANKKSNEQNNRFICYKNMNTDIKRII